MGPDLPARNGEDGQQHGGHKADFTVKTGLARMLKGGVIMDVVNAEQVFLARSISLGMLLIWPICRQE